MDIKLSPLSEKDFDTLIRWAKSPKDLLLWAGPMLKYPLTPEQLKTYYQPSLENNPPLFIYVTRAGNEITAMAELGVVDRINGTGTLCRIYTDEKFRGKGIAGEMIKEILKFGFKELKLRRIDLRVYGNNSSAIKCYEKLGFKYEGNMRKFTKFENEYWDVLIYSMLFDEWEKLYA